MTAQERLAILFCWTGIVVFSALLFLGSGILSAVLVTLYVLISCAVGLGRRRLLQASFAVSLVAIAVLLGFPHPREWPSIGKSLLNAIESNHVAAMR